MTEYEVTGDPIPWETDPKKMEAPDLKRDLERARESIMKDTGYRPPIKIVSFARYQALSKIHQMDESGSFCKVCGDYYTMVNLERCVAK